MAKLPQPDVALRRIVDHYSRYRDIAEEWLPQLGRDVRRRGYFKLEEFMQVCRWKAPRAAKRFGANNGSAVAAATKKAIRASGDRTGMEILLRGLKGVGVPMASALLAAYDPSRYGVIDVRAWQALCTIGLVQTKRSGRDLSKNDWVKYTDLLRRQSTVLGEEPRRLDYILWPFHGCLHPDVIPDQAPTEIPVGQQSMFAWLLD